MTIGKRSSVWRVLSPLVAIVVFSGIHVANATAAGVCFPEAYGVPGRSGSPQWWGAAPQQWQGLDDPRWVGSTYYPFIDGVSDDANFRGVSKDNKLYLSFRVTADSGIHQGTANADSIYVAFFPAAAAPDKPPHLIQLSLNTNTVGNAMSQGSCDNPGTPAQEQCFLYYRRIHDGTSWVDDTGGDYLTEKALWIADEGANHPWAFQIVVDIASLGLGDIKLFYAFAIWQGGGPGLALAAKSWPSPLVGTGTDILNMIPMGTSYSAPVAIGTATSPCVGCITLSRYNVGTTNTPSSLINTTTDASNTFFAHPDYGGLSILPGSVLAQFRIANWGSVASADATWNPIPGAEAVPSNATGQIEWTCTNGGTVQCPTLSTSQTHQCMLVELGAASGYGSDQVCFSQNSVYRNMDFVSASTITRKVEVAVVDAKHKVRDAYLLVTAKNMPEHGAAPITLPLKQMTAARQAAIAPPVRRVIKKAGVRKAGQKAPDKTVLAFIPPDPKLDGKLKLSAADLMAGKSPEEKIEAVWPTYKTHIYKDTGRTVRVGKKKYPLLESQPSFGFHITHDGPLYGWKTDLDTKAGRLKEIVPRFYQLKKGTAKRTDFTATIRSEIQPLKGTLSVKEALPVKEATPAKEVTPAKVKVSPVSPPK